MKEEKKLTKEMFYDALNSIEFNDAKEDILAGVTDEEYVNLKKVLRNIVKSDKDFTTLLEVMTYSLHYKTIIPKDFGCNSKGKKIFMDIIANLKRMKNEAA